MAEDDKSSRWKVVEVLLSSPNLILIVGAIFVALGAAGGVTYNSWFPIADSGWRNRLMAVGLALFAVYLVVMYFRPSKASTQEADESHDKRTRNQDRLSKKQCGHHGQDGRTGEHREASTGWI
jgi:hypothetical protein